MTTRSSADDDKPARRDVRQAYIIGSVRLCYISFAITDKLIARRSLLNNLNLCNSNSQSRTSDLPSFSTCATLLIARYLPSCGISLSVRHTLVLCLKELHLSYNFYDLLIVHHFSFLSPCANTNSRGNPVIVGKKNTHGGKILRLSTEITAYLGNCTRQAYDQAYYGTLTGSHRRRIITCRFQ